MPAVGQQVDPEWQAAEVGLGPGGDVLPGPVVAQAGEPLLRRILVAAAAVLVVGRDGGVVVPGHAGDARSGDQLHHLVGPGRVADEIPQVIYGLDAAPANVRPDRLHGGEVGVDVGQERVAHLRYPVPATA